MATPFSVVIPSWLRAGCLLPVIEPWRPSSSEESRASFAPLRSQRLAAFKFWLFTWNIGKNPHGFGPQNDRRSAQGLFSSSHCGGGFQFRPVGFPHATPDKGGQTAVSCLLARGAYQTRPIGEPSQEDLTFSSRKPGAVIDWILVPEGWSIVAKTTINRPLSDHLAIVMEVEIDRASMDS